MLKVMWFKIENPDGTYEWVRSTSGWSGLVDYAVKMQNNGMFINGTTIRTATHWESLKCFINWLFGNELYMEV